MWMSHSPEVKYVVHLLQRFDPSHELEGVMTRIVSTNIAFEGTFLNQDTRSMVDQSKVGIANPAVDGALALEDTETCSRARARNFPGPKVCDLLVKKYQRFDGCQKAHFHKSIRLVLSKDNASFRSVVNRYVCFQPVPAALL